eukprot:403363696
MINSGSLQQYPISVTNAKLAITNGSSIYSELDFTTLQAYSNFQMSDNFICIYQRPLNQISYNIGSKVQISNTKILSGISDSACKAYSSTFQSFNRMQIVTATIPPQEATVTTLSESSTYPDLEMFYQTQNAQIEISNSQISGFLQRILYAFESQVLFNTVGLANIKSVQSKNSILHMLRSSITFKACALKMLETFNNEIPVIFEGTSAEQLYTQFINSIETTINFSNSNFTNFNTNGEQVVDGLIINSQSGSVIIKGSNFQNIKASGNGGAFYMTNDMQNTEKVQLNITDSSFDDISAKDLGGAVYSENINITLERTNVNNSYLSNKIGGQGGAFYSFCDINNLKYNKICVQNLTQSLFTNNVAFIGGFMKYNLFEPIQNNISLGFNEASYGSIFAAYPITMYLEITIQGIKRTIDPNNIISNYQDYFQTPSGLPLENSFNLILIDVFNQQLMTDFSSLATVTVDPKYTTASVTKNTKVKASKGVYSFNDFILKSKPGSIVELKFSSNAIDQQVIQAVYPGKISAINITIPMRLRYCVRGEIVVDESVQSRNCSQCIKHASCERGEFYIDVNYGYWRSSVDSLEIHQCFYADSCKGGYESECLEGYTGNLCHQCEYSQSTGIKYQRKGLHRCTPCPDHVQNSFIILGMVAIVLLLMGALVKSAVQSLDQENYDAALFRILIDYFHTLMIVRNYDLNWPDSLEQALDTFTLIGQANDKIFSFDCYINDKSSQPVMVSKLILALLVPFFVFMFMYLVWNCCCVCYFTREKERTRIQGRRFSIFSALKEESIRIQKIMPSKVQEVRRHIFISTSVILYLSYPLLCMKAFSVFQCITLDNGQQYLFEQLDIECWNKQHSLWIALLAIPTILIWIASVPGYIFYKIFRRRDELDKKEMLYNYGFWYNGLKNRHFYWEFLLFLKKFLLILNYKIITNHNAIYKLATVIGGILYVIMDASSIGDSTQLQIKYFQEQKYSTQSYFFMSYIMIQNLWFITSWVREFLITLKKGILRKRWPILIRRFWRQLLSGKSVRIDESSLNDTTKQMHFTTDGDSNPQNTDQELIHQPARRLSLLMAGLSKDTNLLKFFEGDLEQQDIKKFQNEHKIQQSDIDELIRFRLDQNKHKTNVNQLYDPYQLTYDDFHMSQQTTENQWNNTQFMQPNSTSSFTSKNFNFNPSQVSSSEQTQILENQDINLREYIKLMREKDPKQLQNVLPFYEHTQNNLLKRVIDKQFEEEDKEAQIVQDRREKKFKKQVKREKAQKKKQEEEQKEQNKKSLGRNIKKLPAKFIARQAQRMQTDALRDSVSSESFDIFDEKSSQTSNNISSKQESSQRSSISSSNSSNSSSDNPSSSSSSNSESEQNKNEQVIPDSILKQLQQRQNSKNTHQNTVNNTRQPAALSKQNSNVKSNHTNMSQPQKRVSQVPNQQVQRPSIKNQAFTNLKARRSSMMYNFRSETMQSKKPQQTENQISQNAFGITRQMNAIQEDEEDKQKSDSEQNEDFSIKRRQNNSSLKKLSPIRLQQPRKVSFKESSEEQSEKQQSNINKNQKQGLFKR